MTGTDAVLALIVEGHGDVYAAPVLVRRLLEQNGDWAHVLHPHRVPKARLPQDLNRAVRLQRDRVGAARGGVLVLLDADSDDPAGLHDDLFNLLDKDLLASVRIAVAVKEYEAWFLAGIESLRPHRSVRDDAEFSGDPESPRDAKGRLEHQMTESYQETIHQAAFSALVDVELVRQKSPSFVRFTQDVLELVTGTEGLTGDEDEPNY